MVLVVLVSLGYGLILSLNTMTLLAPPRLFVMLDAPRAAPMRIAWVRPGSNLWDRGVRQGNHVLALDGYPPTPGHTGLWTGRRMLVRTGAGIITVDADALQRGHDAGALLLLSPWFLLLGTLVFLRAAQAAVGRATYALFAGAAYALALAPGADSDDSVAAVIEFALVPLAATFFVRFFFTFTAPSPPRSTWPRLWLLGPPFVAIVFYFAALLWPPLYATAAFLRLTVVLAYLLLGAGLVVRSFIMRRDCAARRGLAIICAGTALSILPLALLYVLPTLLGRPPLLASEQSTFAMAVLPASFAYAILRHQTLRVHLVQRWLVHGLLWGALLALYTALVYALHGLLVAALPALSHSLLLAVALVLLVGVSFRPLHDALRRPLDHLIFKDTYAYRPALQRLSQDLALAGDASALPATLRRLMNLDFAVLLVHAGGEPVVQGAAGAVQPALLSALVAAAQDVHDAPRAVSLAGDAPAVLFVPLHTHDVLVGRLCLGPKTSDEPFRAEDYGLLATLSGHLAASIRNAHLADDLCARVAALDALNERLEHAHEEERARLAAELHDEPLQTALRLQRHLATGDGHGGVTADRLALSQALIAQLHSLCTDARPAALDDLGLHAALDQLARDLAQGAGLPILLDADPEIGALAPAVETVLYRATQEALNNVLRHASARTVQVSLRRHRDGVRLVVSDDGVGFAVPARLNDLVAQNHRGLAGLQARVERIGGHVCLRSVPRQGTTVQVDLPAGALRP